MRPSRLFVVLSLMGMVAVMAVTNWLDPNWRYELSNALIAWIAIGTLAGALAFSWFGLRQLPKMSLLGAMAICALAGAVLSAIGGGMAWLLLQKHPVTGATVVNETATGISPAVDWNEIAQDLRPLRTEFTNAFLMFVGDQRPKLESLRGSFGLAGWETDANPSAFDGPRQGGWGRYYVGTEVKGHNQALIEQVARILTDAGFSDAFTTLEPLNIPHNNPRWNRLQQRVTILIGYPKQDVGRGLGITFSPERNVTVGPGLKEVSITVWNDGARTARSVAVTFESIESLDGRQAPDMARLVGVPMMLRGDTERPPARSVNLHARSHADFALMVIPAAKEANISLPHSVFKLLQSQSRSIWSTNTEIPYFVINGRYRFKFRVQGEDMLPVFAIVETGEPGSMDVNVNTSMR